MSRRRRLFASVLFALATAVLVAAEPEGKKYALLVGVKRYSDGTGLRNLDYTENDVNAMAQVLEKQGYRVTILTREQAVKQDKDFLRPTAKNIREHLAALTKACKDGDTLLVAVSGHGAHLKSTNRLYFCPQDTDLKDEKTLLSVDDVMAAFDGKNCLASSKVLIMDACRNDPADGATGAKPDDLQSLTRPLVKEPPGGTVALFSCSKGEISHESGQHKRGFLFHHVIEGLSGKAANKKTGEVTWLGLASYVADELPAAVRADKGPKVTQTPEVLGAARNLVLARVAVADIAPPDEKTETYIWKGEKRTRTVRTLKCGTETMEFVRVPAGKFTMGSDKKVDKNAMDDETPAHEVTFTKPLWVAKYPVTKGQFTTFVKAKGYTTEPEEDGVGGSGYDGKQIEGRKSNYSWKDWGHPNETDRHPVVNVTWNDAAAFCDWICGQNKMKSGFAKTDGKWDLTDYKRPGGVRLLTEAEYEYANRGGQTTIYITGDQVQSLEGYANIADKSAAAKSTRPFGWVDIDDGEPFTSAVGKYKANGFGLHDMTGNVYSWCLDRYDSKLYARGDVQDPGANGSGEQKSDRVLRGGSCSHWEWNNRTASRLKIAPNRPDYTFGFRVCVALD